MLTPTPEQQAIISAGQDSQASLMVTAYAGCAKTSTLVMLANSLATPGLAVCFNKKTKDELEKRFPPTWILLTLNGLGHRAWGKAIGKRCEVDDRKLGKLISKVNPNLSQDDWAAVRSLVTKAMQSGIVPKGYPHKSLLPDTESTWADLCDDLWQPADRTVITTARTVLAESVKLGFEGVLSFDDQIYLSAMLGGVFPRFGLVMVDEAQDLSPLNHLQVAKAAAGRLIAVGDPKQAIYAFRGADSSSMDKIRALRKDWIDLPLTMTFRCPQAVVQRQQQHAPGFTAAAANALGKVLNQFCKTLAYGEEPFGQEHDEDGEITQVWDWAGVQAQGYQDVAILCRNNAPLLAMAFKLLKQRVGCKMLGREIGKSLIALSKKILPDDDLPALDCARLVQEWREREESLARANGHEEKVAGILDRAESLQAVLEGSGAETAGQLRKELGALFSKDSGQVTLSTIHRAKGLEWDTVIHLDPWRIPSKWAKSQAELVDKRQLQQEYNLRYVAETRAKQILLLCNLADFR